MPAATEQLKAERTDSDNNNGRQDSAEADSQEQLDLATHQAIQALARQLSREDEEASPPLASEEAHGRRASGSVPPAATHTSHSLPPHISPAIVAAAAAAAAAHGHSPTTTTTANPQSQYQQQTQTPLAHPHAPAHSHPHPHPHPQYQQQLTPEPTSASLDYSSNLRWKNPATVGDASGDTQDGHHTRTTQFGVLIPTTVEHHHNNNRVASASAASSPPPHSQPAAAQHRPQASSSAHRQSSLSRLSSQPPAPAPAPAPVGLGRPSLTPLTQPPGTSSVLSHGQPTPVTPHQQHGPEPSQALSSSSSSRVQTAKPYPRQQVLYFGPQPAPAASPTQAVSSSSSSSRDRVVSKPKIMDPPARKVGLLPPPSQRQPEPRGSFPSPTRDHAALNPKFVDDVARMTFAVQQSLPEAVRRIVRDNWEKCLLGSEFHQAFVFNAAIHHAMPSITRRAVRDFGQKLVRENKGEVMHHYTQADLDELSDAIIGKASNGFLDKCLQARLATIDAPDLVNFLARAGRLGYDASDIVVDNEQEHVVPQASASGPGIANGFAQSAANLSAAPHGLPQQAVPTPASGPSTSSALQCMSCYRTFQSKAAYDYHHREKVCKCLAPGGQGFAHACNHCGQGFTDINDMQHHISQNFCGEPPKPANPAGAPPKPAKRGPGRPPRVSGAPRSSPAVNTPAGKSSSAAKLSAPIFYTPSGTPKAGSGGTNDPYAHLTPEQLDAMKKELEDANVKYAPRFAEIEAIEDEAERSKRLDSLRNSFGTRQSMIRKKYGVRLRERRTKAEIQAERDQLAMAITNAKKDIGSAEGAVATAAAASTLMQQQQQQQQQQQNQSSEAQAGAASAWSAANTAATNEARGVWAEHDAKRRRLDHQGGYENTGNDSRGGDDTPSRKAIVPVSQMTGGLAGSAATAATRDPTTLAPPLAPRPAALMQEAADLVDLTQSPMGNGTDTGSPHPSAAFADAAGQAAGSEYMDTTGAPGDPVHALMSAVGSAVNPAGVPAEDEDDGMTTNDPGLSDDSSDSENDSDDNSEEDSDEE